MKFDAATIKVLAPRLTLALAFFVPTLVVVMRDPVPDRMLNMIAWSIVGCLLVASLPGRSFSLVLCAGWISTPVALWWTGYASLNGMGPGLEAADAALETTRGELHEAAILVLRSNGFIAASAGYVGLLLVATVLWVRQAKAPEATSAERAVKGVLLGAIAPLAAALCWQTFDPDAPALVSHVDAMAFPLGTYVGLGQSAFDRAVYGWRDTHFARNPVTDSTKVTAPVLALLVIGESTRADALGPAKVTRGPWTKMLDDRFKLGLGTWLPATCASAHGTHLSVPMFITGTPPEHVEDAKRAPSGLARLKAAGFATAWITNQDLSVFKDAGHDFAWMGPIDYKYRYDDVLLPIAQMFAAPLLAADASRASPRAIVLHLMGSHFLYHERYPQKFFAPEPAAMSEDALLELRYDRANEYGAYILTQIGALLDRSAVPAFAVFASDHGENLPSDRNGLLTHIGPRTSRWDGTTSSLVLWNKAMADTGLPQSRLARLRAANMIAHQDVYHAWMTLAGVENAIVEPTPDPTIWANLDVGSDYRPVSCSLLKP